MEMKWVTSVDAFNVEKNFPLGINTVFNNQRMYVYTVTIISFSYFNLISVCTFTFIEGVSNTNVIYLPRTISK